MTIKELFAPSDMTVGKPWEKIVAFTIPMLIGNIAQQLYNTVDSIVIGKYVGDNALAAVGSASPILTCFWFCSSEFLSALASWCRSILEQDKEKSFR